jgi:hypothetical protein
MVTCGGGGGEEKCIQGFVGETCDDHLEVIRINGKIFNCY